MAYRYGSSSYGTPSYGSSSYGAGSYGLGSYPTRYGGLYTGDRAGGTTTAGSTGYTGAQRVPPPAGQDPGIRDRWHSSSTATSASADRIGQDRSGAAPYSGYTGRYASPARESAYSAGYPQRAPSPAREAAPAAPPSTPGSAFPQYTPQYAPAFSPNPSVSEPLRDRWHSSSPAAGSADRLGAYGSYQHPAAAAPQYGYGYGYGSASRLSSSPSRPFTPTRTCYRPDPAPLERQSAPTATQSRPESRPAQQEGQQTAPQKSKAEPQKSKAELAAERQRKIDSKRETLARAAQGSSGGEPLALDLGGQCHKTAGVLNAVPFAVDNSGRCHPSPARQRPVSTEQQPQQPQQPQQQQQQQQPQPSEDRPSTGLNSSKPPPLPAPQPPPSADLLQDEESFVPESPSKGSVHLYREQERVTVVSVHRDDCEPYYTIRMPDGREKQTVGARLSPVIQRTRAAGLESPMQCPAPIQSAPAPAPVFAPAPPVPAPAPAPVVAPAPAPVVAPAPAPVVAPAPAAGPRGSEGVAALELSEDRSVRIQQLSAHLAQLKKQRSDLLAQPPP